MFGTQRDSLWTTVGVRSEQVRSRRNWDFCWANRGSYGGYVFQGLALVYIDTLILAAVASSRRLEYREDALRERREEFKDFFSERSGTIFAGQY